MEKRDGRQNQINNLLRRDTRLMTAICKFANCVVSLNEAVIMQIKMTAADVRGGCAAWVDSMAGLGHV